MNGAYCMLLKDRRVLVGPCNGFSLLLPTQVGKRRGGAKLALKTGVVAKKQKPDSEVSHEDFSKILFIFKSPS